MACVVANCVVDKGWVDLALVRVLLVGDRVGHPRVLACPAVVRAGHVWCWAALARPSAAGTPGTPAHTAAAVVSTAAALPQALPADLTLPPPSRPLFPSHPPPSPCHHRPSPSPPCLALHCSALPHVPPVDLAAPALAPPFLPPPCRGFGIVRFSTKDLAEVAVETMNNQVIGGRVVSVRIDRFA